MGLEHLDTVFAFSIIMLLLSLVITMAIQGVVAILGMRSNNLLWGITRVIERSDKLKDYAGEIANAALTHTSIASPTGRSATAIGSDELLAILKELVSKKDNALNSKAKTALKQYIDDIVPPQAQTYAIELADEIKKQFPQETSKIDDALNKMQDKASKFSGEINQWFDTIMNRTTDRFVLHTRFISIILALFLCLGLQLDSLELLKNLSTNPELRAKLIQSADTTLARARSELKTTSIAVQTLEAITPDITALKGVTIPSNLVTRAEATSWLTQQIQAKKDQDDAIEKFEKKFDELTRTRLGSIEAEFKNVRADLEKSRLVVLPASWEEYKTQWQNFGAHILGIIISVLLLSLGAPFWFNVLRTVATLRPILAGTTDPSKGDHRKK